MQSSLLLCRFRDATLAAESGAELELACKVHTQVPALDKVLSYENWLLKKDLLFGTFTSKKLFFGTTQKFTLKLDTHPFGILAHLN